jgi:hypothetical protein
VCCGLSGRGLSVLCWVLSGTSLSVVCCQVEGCVLSGRWVCVVCCQVEVSATNRSIIQGSPTDCGASLCVIKKPRVTKRP